MTQEYWRLLLVGGLCLGAAPERRTSVNVCRSLERKQSRLLLIRSVHARDYHTQQPTSKDADAIKGYIHLKSATMAVIDQCKLHSDIA